MISQATIDEIKDKIIDLEDPQQIILFGSYAKNNATDSSDLDLLIVKDSTLPPSDRALELRWELAYYPFEIDLLIKTPEEFEKWQDVEISLNATIKQEGNILYEKNKLQPFIYKTHKKLADK